MEVMRKGCSLNTKVYKKPTDSGLLLHYLSHVDGRHKRLLLNIILNCGFKLSSTWKFFHEECERLKETFSRLCYPQNLVQATISQFIKSEVSEDPRTQVSEKREAPIASCCPLKIKNRLTQYANNSVTSVERSK